MGYQRKRAASPEADLSHKRAELFRKSTGVIAFCAGWLVGVSVATHVGHEDREPCVLHGRHHLAPSVAGAEETVPE